MESWLETFARASFRRSADTAHDLKTPLNVAVLNLELLRMRLRKLTGAEEDQKIATYASAIELELRRMGRIVDAFFLLSTPPKGEEAPDAVNVAPICAEAAASSGFPLESGGELLVAGHEARIRQAIRLFFEGASTLFAQNGRTAESAVEASRALITAAGIPAAADFEPTKIFKFYYTGPDGNPDLSLAVARLIAETYGGELNALQDRDKVSLRLAFPQGAR